MVISTPDTHKESEALNTFSMSYEIDSGITAPESFEANGFGLRFDDAERPDFTEKIRDDAADSDEFYDPSPEYPMDAARFLSHLNLNMIADRLKPYYVDLEHFRYPIDAMIRTLVYQRLAGLKYLTELESKIHNSIGNHIAKDLGFQCRADGSFAVPNRRTIHHFLWERLGKQGTGLILDSLVVELRKRLAFKGMWLGSSIAVDSTPLEAMFTDKKADYNGHYELHMYKVHHVVCLQTGLSLAKIVTKANAYDGDYLVPLIKKLNSLGIRVEEVVGDQHYGMLENWAELNINMGIKTYFNLTETNIYRFDGTPDKLVKRYNSLWQEPEYVVNANPEYMLEFLMRHGFAPSVGAYFRNKWMELKNRDPQTWQEVYNKRTAVERFNSHVKERLGLEREVCVKGIKRIDVYTDLFWIAELATALTRVQNGVAESLLRANQRELF
jgi:hypothetical protein